MVRRFAPLALSLLLLAFTGAVVGIAYPLGQWTNVRGNAGNTTQTPIATVLRGTGIPICGAATVKNGESWLPVCTGGYVAAAVVGYTPFPPATSTPRPTVGIVTPTPSRIVPTATIQGLQTVTPHPTIDPYIVYEYGRDGRLEGAWLYCSEPCQWHITVENLP